jgi:hypothetical protein
MPVAKPTTSMDISDIQRRMAQIRHEMHQEVQGAVKGAQSLTDWRIFVKSHPWLSISLASVVGYLIVPTRRSAHPTIVTVGSASPEFVTTATARDQKPQPKSSKWSIVGTAFSLLAPIAVRGAQSYLLGHLEQWLSQHPLPPLPGEAPTDRPTRGSGQSAPLSPTDRLRNYG